MALSVSLAAVAAENGDPPANAAAATAQKGTAAPADFDFFEAKIRPLLAAHCYACHSDAAQEGDLRLDWREGWAKGGQSGPAIIPGKPDDTLLVRAVRRWDKNFSMPPDTSLSATEVADLVEWVKRGAPDPRNTAPAAAAPQKSASAIDYEKGRQHWSFQPLGNPPLPEVRDQSWQRSEVDRFTLAQMEHAGITPVQEADRRSLIRRATFDLTGLPPTPAEVEAFVNDAAPDAFVRLVDRLLASPRYGEHWGRHWLDVVRYADTCGNASDFPVPQAVKYRNYVIAAFNSDLPYDRFIRQQIAGDLLPAASDGERFNQTVATGYLAIARYFGGGKGEPHLTLDDAIDNLGRTFLGLSISCARCHDHKFDPVSQHDYYAIYGIFSSTRFPHPGSEGMNRPADLVALLPGTELESAKQAWQAQIAASDAEIKKLEAEVGELSKQPEGEERNAKLARANGSLGAMRAHHKQLTQTVPYEQAYAVSEGKAADAQMHVRGDPQRLGKQVPRGFLQVLGGQTLPKDQASSGRLELASWIADPANPLTARVMVNRIWQYHFGRGLVPTPNDFGARGLPPTHPELLDYLAQRFIRGGWSVKSMHRLILLSHTWQLASLAPDASTGELSPAVVAAFETDSAIDPHNAKWWHADHRRLDAESIRDSLLFISGDLDLSPPGVHPFPPVHTWEFTQHQQFFAVYDNRQRTIYQMQQRLRRHPFLELFDGADPNLSTAARNASTTPLQTLFIMNDKFVHDQAAKIAAQVTSGQKDDATAIDIAFRLLYARPPQAEELRLAADYLTQMRSQLSAKNLDPSGAWPSLVRALLGANEFIFLD